MSANVALRSNALRESGKAAVVVFYHTHEGAEEVIRELQRSNFDMRQLSIVTTGDRVKAWGKSEAFWDELGGMLFGGGPSLVPPKGSLFVAGQLVGWIGAALEGTVVVSGLSALGAALYSIGIPQESINDYESRVKRGNVLLIAHGSRIA
jgi:hypothetical protein